MAFLDVMACGLGAAILLFFIIKFHTDVAEDPKPGPDPADTQQVLAQLQKRAAELTARIKGLESQEQQAAPSAPPEPEDEAVSEVIAKLARINKAIALEKARNEGLRKEVEAFSPAQAADTLPEVNQGEEEYLLGMPVEGTRIAILLDRSASMTDERLIDVITRTVDSDAEKRQGPKWQRTLRVVRWLLQRAPKASLAAVIAYADKAEVVGGTSWIAASKPEALRGMFRALDKLVPTGPTNLEAGLKALAALRPTASDIYVITDGLPTRSISSPRRFMLRCGSRPRNTVSGECRLAQFNATMANSAPPTHRKVNVILLPLEGDPKAAPAYWWWTAQTGGLLMTPAGNWP